MNKATIIKETIKAKLFKNFKPIFVSWSITNKCNGSCIYCHVKDLDSNELATKDILNIIDDLEFNGTKRISLVGGEALIREDINEIVNRIKRKGIHLTITTNGKLVPDKIETVRKADLIKLSYDGPRQIHDLHRGSGSYESFLKALSEIRKTNAKLVLNCTISKHNISMIQEIINFAMKNKAYIKFQPVSHVYAHKINVDNLIPSKKQLIEAGNILLKNRQIINSPSSIKYYCFGQKSKFKQCCAGKILCRIATNGDIYPCTIKEYKCRAQSCVDVGIKNAFDNIVNEKCSYCQCSSTLELNNAYNFKMDTIFHLIKTGF